MADNKAFDSPIRGGYKTSFVLICVKSRAKFKVDLMTKKHNGKAITRIIAMNGIHKLPYKCTVYTDGCGSMALVKDVCISFGIDHQYIPPYEQSLNEAEKVCDRMWASARTLMLASNADDKYFGFAVEYSMYVDLRMSTIVRISIMILMIGWWGKNKR